MKYFIEDDNVLPKPAPDGSEVHFGTNKRESSEEEFNKILEEFFESNNNTALEIEEANTQIWQYLRAGKTVTIEDKVLSMKK